MYFFWWFAVDFLLPGSFNPLRSRLFVCLVIFGILGLSYFSDKVRQSLRFLFVASCWLVTAHYFYLFHGNGGAMDWVVGSYITIIAINLALLSRFELMSYSAFVMGISGFLTWMLPGLNHSVFFPGMVTILIQANIGMRNRLELIKTLEASNRRFQLLFNSTFEGVFVHENGIIVNVNDALTRMFGFSRDEFIGRSILDILPPDEHDRALQGMRLENSEPYQSKGMTRSGTMIDVEFRAKNFLDGKRLARLVTVLDISDRKRVEREKIKTLAMKENVRIRDEFISIASHELRTPISTLKLQTQLIERDLKKSDERRISKESAQEFIALFHRQIDRLTELVEAMLDVSRISGGKLSLEVRQFDLSHLLRETVESLQLQADKSAVFFQMDFPESLLIAADRRRIEQVVENVLTNALKYGDGKPVTIRVYSLNSQAVVEVEDQGIGIGEEYLDRIFERFERAISPRNISGLGLGLYIARQIARAHGGTITVKSKLGYGSTFTIKIPLAQEEKNLDGHP